MLTASAPLDGKAIGPLHTQKLVFLVERRLEDYFQRLFNFEAGDYGPFDKSVYRVLRDLQAKDDAILSFPRSFEPTTYRLSVAGQRRAEALVAPLPEKARDYLGKLGKWVYDLSFTSLLAAVNKAYPDFAYKSVFSRYEVAERATPSATQD